MPPASHAIPPQRLAGLRYARAAGVAVGLFLIAWSPFNVLRWQDGGQEALLNFQFLFFIAYGVLLALPWSRIHTERTFRLAFGILIVFSAAFAFVMVIDLMFQAVLASNTESKPAPPAFQGMLLFGALLQLPTVLFSRRPQLLG